MGIGPQNAVIGSDFVAEVPQKPEDKQAELELHRKARYSKSKEFQELRALMESRIDYWQKFLPGGIAPISVPEAERGKYWAIADELIKEFRAILQGYELAEELSKDGQ